jgi:hypothetical protein
MILHYPQPHHQRLHFQLEDNFHYQLHHRHHQQILSDCLLHQAHLKNHRRRYRFGYIGCYPQRHLRQYLKLVLA